MNPRNLQDWIFLNSMNGKNKFKNSKSWKRIKIIGFDIHNTVKRPRENFPTILYEVNFLFHMKKKYFEINTRSGHHCFKNIIWWRLFCLSHTFRCILYTESIDWICNFVGLLHHPFGFIFFRHFLAFFFNFSTTFFD